MKVSAVFTPLVHDADPDDSLADAATRMRENDVSSLAVLQDGQLMGIITERDLVQAIADGAAPATARVSEYLTLAPVASCTPDEDSTTVAWRMLQAGVRHLFVVKGGEPIGMVSARDFLSLEALPYRA